MMWVEISLSSLLVLLAISLVSLSPPEQSPALPFMQYQLIEGSSVILAQGIRTSGAISVPANLQALSAGTPYCIEFNPNNQMPDAIPLPLVSCSGSAAAPSAAPPPHSVVSQYDYGAWYGGRLVVFTIRQWSNAIT